MSEADTPKHRIDPETIQFLPSNLPNIYADFVPSIHIISGGVTKIGLVRIDPAIGDQPAAPVLVGYLTMPTSGFLNAVAYFNARVQIMKDSGELGVKELDQMEKDRSDNLEAQRDGE